MAVYGQLHPFDPDEEDWKSYIQRAKLYFSANRVTDDDQKRAIIPSCCGPKTFQIIKNVVAPADPGTLSIAQLETAVGDHYNPKPTATVQRCLFNSRIRNEGESIPNFVAALKKLSEHCGYTDDQLKENLRDRLICGINHERWQKRLLTEDGADYQRVLEVALSLEAAEKGVDDLQGRKLNQLGQHSASGNKGGGEGACFRCGRSNHKSADCYFKDATCRHCGKKGHIWKACKSRINPTQHPRGHRPAPQRPQGAHHLAEPADSPQELEEDTEYTQHALYTLPGKTKPILVTVSLDGSDLDMEVDTGASLSVISEATYRRLWSAGSAPVVN